MAIAIIPINEKANSDNRDNWLSMNKVDEMICNYLNIDCHSSKFYKDWFNNFYYFDWRRAKRFSNDNYSVEFTNAEQALTYYFHEYNVRYCDIIEDKKFIDENIKEVIDVIYKLGYKIISLNLR